MYIQEIVRSIIESETVYCSLDIGTLSSLDQSEIKNPRSRQSRKIVMFRAIFGAIKSTLKVSLEIMLEILPLALWHKQSEELKLNYVEWDEQLDLGSGNRLFFAKVKFRQD